MSKEVIVMRLAGIVVLTGILASCIGCESTSSLRTAPADDKAGVARSQSAPPEISAARETPAGGGGGSWGDVPRVQPVSFDQAVESQTAASAFDRKIIRNATLSIETDDPSAAHRRVGSIAESHGGFVVTSDFKQTASAQSTVTVVVRVPAAAFDVALGAIRSAGGTVKEENVAGKDVTEEYIDLEARIKTQKALEEQFLEIMKQARKVSDALEVQTQIANVRTEIEQLEGRRRFLQNQAALSTITVTFRTPAPVVTATATGFGHSLKQAFGESVDVAVAIVLGLMRLVIVMIPILLLIVLPLGFVIRVLVRRYAPKKTEPVAQS
jgi:hypothetical protein